jgi:hypothetical protein
MRSIIHLYNSHEIDIYNFVIHYLRWIIRVTWVYNDIIVRCYYYEEDCYCLLQEQ